VGETVGTIKDVLYVRFSVTDLKVQQRFLEDFGFKCMINRDLLTRFKVNVNPNRKFVLSHWIERSDGNDTRGVNLPLEKR